MNEPIIVLYIFYTELGTAGAKLRAVRADRGYWTDTMRAIEQRHGSVRASSSTGGKQSRQSLQGRVVAHVHLLGSNADLEGPVLTAADAAGLRDVDSCVPRLVCGSMLQQGDVLVVRRVPDSVFWAHDRDERVAWRQRQQHAVSSRESAADVASRCHTAERYADLVRGIDWRVRRHAASEAGGAAGADGSTVQFTDDMSEQARIDAIVAYDGGPARGRRPSDGAQRRARFPPADYVCERCGVDGHWLSDCPTHDDKQFDQRRIVRAKGIPRRFLRAADTSSADQKAVGLVLPTSSHRRDAQIYERVRPLDAPEANV